MECCLLCLNLENIRAGGIRVNSVQWRTENIKYIIEKHLWPMDTANLDHAICITCWVELEKFHTFYLLIEKTHTTLSTIQVSKESTQNENNTCENAKIPEKCKEKQYRNKEDVLIQQPFPAEYMIDNKKPKSFEFSFATQLTVQDYGETVTQNDTVTAEVSKNRNAALDANTKSASDTDHEEENSVPENCKKKRKNPDKKTREEHDQIIAEHLQISCCLCQVPLANFIALRKHFREVHKKRGFMICCKKKFFNRPVLVDHLNFHLNPNYFKCELCEKVYSDRCTLDKHIKTHMNNEEGEHHTCDECGKSFVSTTRLESHKHTHAPDYEKKCSCSECGKLFTTIYNLNYHIQAIHRNKYAKVCDICGKTIRNSFKLHMEKHDKKLATPIPCDICGLRLINKRSLKQHENSQHPVGGRKEHSCHVCLKVSTSLRALRTHIRFAHETGYIHKCSLCDKAFKRPESLKEHMATHTGTPLYSCPWCPRTFKSNGNMYTHRKNVHPEKWKELKRQKYLLQL